MENFKVDTPKQLAEAYARILEGLEMPTHVRKEGAQNVVDELSYMIESCTNKQQIGTDVTERVYWTEVLNEFKKIKDEKFN